MKIEKKEHDLWRETKKFNLSVDSPVGRCQYIFSSEKGKISLIQLKNYFADGIDIWEIFCLNGNLFKDVERFDTKEEAEKAIRGYLE